MIEIALKAKITVLREHWGFEAYDGNFDDLKYRLELAYARHYPRKILSHEHTVESTHSAKPSLSPSERLRVSLSSHNVAHT